MPEEKNTLEQTVEAAEYHTRGSTLRELALSNLLEKNLSPESNLPNCEWYNLFSGRISGDVPGVFEYAFDFLGIVGWDSATPAAELQLNIGGERFTRYAADGGFTDKFLGGIIENNVLLVFGSSEEVQKLNNSTAALERKNSGGTKDSLCAAFGDDVFLIGGGSGSLLKSTDDGETWVDKSAAINTGENIIGLAYISNRFVAIDDEGGCYYSNDLGESWSARILLPTLPGYTGFEPNGLIANGEQLLVFGEVEHPTADDVMGISRSTNGVSWETTPLNSNWDLSPLSLRDGAYANGVYVITTGESFAFFSYDDGETWYYRSIPIKLDVRVSAGYRNVFWFVGYLSDEQTPAIFASQRLY